MKLNLILFFLFAPFAFVFSQVCNENNIDRRSIKASRTDDNINFELQNHQVYINTDCESNDKLLVHLVGSFDNPANTTFFPILAANYGYKVIVLKYPNQISAAGACANNTDTLCFSKFREEILFGTDISDQVNVNAANSVVNRLKRLILYLASEFPLEKWEQHLSELDSINWTNIVLSGHSQGGGHAVYLAKQYSVDRVLMFASPNDFSNTYSAPGNWISSPSITPIDRYYAFGHSLDDVVDFSQQFSIWEQMGLLNNRDSILVDDSSADWQGAQVLYTMNNSSTVFSGNHNSVIIDNFTPLEMESPIFVPVWAYMLGVDDMMTNSSYSILPSIFTEVFPNPTNGILLLRSEVQIEVIEVYNVLGALVRIERPKAMDCKIDLHKLNGPHFIKIRNHAGHIQIAKVVIE